MTEITPKEDELLAALENMSGWARIFLKQLRAASGKPHGGYSFDNEYKEAAALIERLKRK